MNRYHVVKVRREVRDCFVTAHDETHAVLVADQTNAWGTVGAFDATHTFKAYMSRSGEERLCQWCEGVLATNQRKYCSSSCSAKARSLQIAEKKRAIKTRPA